MAFEKVNRGKIYILVAAIPRRHKLNNSLLCSSLAFLNLCSSIPWKQLELGNHQLWPNHTHPPTAWRRDDILTWNVECKVDEPYWAVLNVFARLDCPYQTWITSEKWWSLLNLYKLLVPSSLPHTILTDPRNVGFQSFWEGVLCCWRTTDLWDFQFTCCCGTVYPLSETGIFLNLEAISQKPLHFLLEDKNYLKATGQVFADYEVIWQFCAFLGLKVVGKHDHRTWVHPKFQYTYIILCFLWGQILDSPRLWHSRYGVLFQVQGI